MFVILGATGNIGRATVGELCKAGAPVRAVVRNREAAEDLDAMGCEIAIADIQDSEALRNVMRDATAVQVLCPPNVRAEDVAADMQAKIASVVRALDESRPRSILAVSDYGAHLAADTGITLAFRHFEDELKKLDIPLTLLRSAEHMQNWSRMAKRAIEHGVLPSMHHPVTKRFPTVSAPDVGLVAAELLMSGEKAPQRIVHVEGPVRYSADDVARILGKVVDRPIVARELPRQDWIPLLVGGGLSANYVELIAKMFDAHNAGSIDVEPDMGEIRLGKTGLDQVFASMKGVA